MDAALRNAIANPRGQSFHDYYVSLGRANGKKQLNLDCRRLKLRVSSEALTIIEKGFSAKARKTWANGADEMFDVVTRGDDKKITSKDQTYEEKIKALEKKEEDEKALKLAKLEALKKKKLEMRQQKKWDKIKEKGANLDSWESWAG